MRVRVYMLGLLCWCFSACVVAKCPESMPTGWCWPTGTSNLGHYLDWHGLNPSFPGEKHLAKDIDAEENDPVFAIADGRVLIKRADVGGYGGVGKSGGGMVIRHTAQDGTTFDVLYAHLKDMTVRDTVEYGEVIARIGPYPYADGSRHDHLHFGMSFPSRNDSYYRGSRGMDPIWDGYGIDDEGFYSPLLFLQEHSIEVSRIECHRNGICWKVGNSSEGCYDGSDWTKDGIAAERSVCGDVIDACRWDEGLQYSDSISDRRWIQRVRDWFVRFWRIDRVNAAEVEC